MHRMRMPFTRPMPALEPWRPRRQTGPRASLLDRRQEEVRLIPVLRASLNPTEHSGWLPASHMQTLNTAAMNQRSRTIIVFAIVEFVVIAAAMAWFLVRGN